MRLANHALTMLMLLGLAAPALAQDAQFTPPRLRITTKPQKNADASGLQVSAVAPTGLGDKLGLKTGDIIKKIKVGDANNQKVWTIESANDLTRCLATIRDATLNSKRTAQVSIEVHSKQKAKTINGAIIRAEVPDRFDGGTLYLFRTAGKDDPRGGK